MTKSESGQPPWEVDVFDAKEAVRRGHEQPLGAYLRDAAKGAALLAETADPINGDAAPTLIFLPKKSAADADALDEDFDGTSDQIKRAIDRGNMRAIGWYLRGLSELLDLTAEALSDANRRLEWKLKFARRRSGRPVDRQRQSVERAIDMQLRFAKARGVKQESRISELMQKYGISRATIMRINQRRKPKRSHKKR
jgi:hypothetical protein